MEKTIIKKETFPQRLSDLMSEFGENTYSISKKLGMSAADSLTEQEKALLAFYRSASEERKQEIIQFVKQKTNGSD